MRITLFTCPIKINMIVSKLGQHPENLKPLHLIKIIVKAWDAFFESFTFPGVGDNGSW